jgi:cytochrome d ubiquinol oxidase subunit I
MRYQHWEDSYSLSFMDALDLARWQFGITTVYHFLFVPMTIGLTWLVAIMQTKWNRTGNEAWLRLTKLFGKLFLINFAAGVVTGIVQEFQFGLNWSEYSRFVGDIFGAPLALEALIAFFMESTFVGLWIFGWDKLPKGLHLATIYLTAIGTTISAIFILAANSWMQNPVGAKFDVESGRAELTNFIDLVLNPFFLTTFPHTITASFVLSGGLVAAVAGWWFAKSRLPEGAPYQADAAANATTWRSAARFGAWFVVVAGVLAVLSGHFMGQVEAKYQPMKLAASEGICDTTAKSGFSVFSTFEKNADGTYTCNSLIEIPGGIGSFMAYNDFDATVQGVNDLAKVQSVPGNTTWTWDGTQAGEGNALQTGAADAGIIANYMDADGKTITIDPVPSMGVSFYSFRLMMGFGGLAILIGLIVLIATRGTNVPKPSPLWTLMMVALPLLPLLANSFGWILAEMGRQPWIVMGVLPLQMAVSHTVTALEVGLTMVLFTLVYLVVAVIVVKLFLNEIRKGLPVVKEPAPEDADKPLSFAY